MQPPPAVRNIDIPGCWKRCLALPFPDVPAPGLRPVWGDGHAWRVLLESGTDAFQNDAFEATRCFDVMRLQSQWMQVVMENPLDEAVDYRIVFHYAAPKKITGPSEPWDRQAQMEYLALLQAWLPCCASISALPASTCS